MPVAIMASAISLMSCSLTLHPNLFQLFHPIGGVCANALNTESGTSFLVPKYICAPAVSVLVSSRIISFVFMVHKVLFI